MHTAPRFLILILAVACLVPGPMARAAGPPPSSITYDQAAQLLDTLKDPEKREHFTATLEEYIKALPSSDSAAAGQVGPIGQNPHAPSALKRGFSRVQTAGSHLVQDLRSVTDLPALSVWVGGRFADPAERTAFYQAALRIALILAITIGSDSLSRWIVRRRRAPSREVHDAGADTTRLHQDLKRWLVRFAGTMAPMLAGNASILLIANLPVARTVAFGIVNTYIALRVMFALLDEFMAESAAPVRHSSAHPVPTGLRTLLAALLIVIALQLLSRDISAELGSSPTIQDALAKCIALVAHLLAILTVLVSRQTASNWIRRGSRPETRWGVIADAVAAIWPTLAICVITGSWLVWALEIPDAYEKIIRLLFATLAILLVSRLITNLVLTNLDQRMSHFSSEPAGTIASRLYGYRNAARLIVRVVLVASTLLALTEAWGIRSLAWLSEGHSGHRLAEFTVQSLVLTVVGIACWEAADLAFERRVNNLVGAASLSRATRLRTLQPIIRLALLVIIALLVVMTALNAVGINVGPLLAGASIIGVALGFGSQKLVQDFITGIFLLVEDAMDVGDWVTLAGVSGTVEHISIRSIRLRGGDGSVYLVPFSSVTSVNNTNRGLGNAAVTANIDPSEDTDRVSALLVDIAREMRREPEFASGMLSDLQLWGVDKVDGSMVTIAGQIVCSDAARWSVQREFNRRLKLRFERDKIKLAVPQQTLRFTPTPEVDAGKPDGAPSPANHHAEL